MAARVVDEERVSALAEDRKLAPRQTGLGAASSRALISGPPPARARPPTSPRRREAIPDSSYWVLALKVASLGVV
jgi:hypothetical protein